MRTKGQTRKVRSSAELELPAVRTTIVGGRPPGSGKPIGPIPRGIEVLVKKASVDPAFKVILLEHRSRAADEIGLILEEAEALMLDIVPAAQLEAIIARTKVDRKVLPAFLGKAAAVMLVALGAGAVTAQQVRLQNGVRVANPAPATAPAPAQEPVLRPIEGPVLMVGIVPLPVEIPPASAPTATQDSQPTSLPAAQVEQVQKLIAQLDAEKYEDREAAQKKLIEMGKVIVPVLREARASDKHSLEVKTRLDTILNKLSPPAVTPRPYPPAVAGVMPARPPVPPPDKAVGGGGAVGVVVQGGVVSVAAPEAPTTTQASQPTSGPASAPALGPPLKIAGITVRPLPAPVEVEQPDQPVPQPLPPIRVAGIVVGPLPMPLPPTTTQASQPTSHPTSKLALSRDQIDKLVAQLDADQFADREGAQKKLQDLGPAVVPILKEHLAGGKLQLEAKTRVETIINKFSPTPTPPDLRLMRGLRADVPLNARQVDN